jgi:hypothetical protein
LTTRLFARHAAAADRVSADRRRDVAAFAALGVVIGHQLAYVLAIPDQHARTSFLSRTGHAYFPMFARAALLACSVALLTSVLRRLGRSGPSVGAFALSQRVAPLQALGFVALETVERLTSHASFEELLHRDLLIGVLVQVSVAAVLSWSITMLRRAARTALAPGTSPIRQRVVVRLFEPTVRRPHRPVLTPRSPRAPPALRVA